MARAMVERMSFALAGNGGVEGAPVLTTKFTMARDGLAFPQYPGLYAILAAPFYAMFGTGGLIMMNALAGVAVFGLTFRIARQLYGERTIAWIAVALMGLASYLTSYTLVIWPHILALGLVMAGIERAIAASEDGATRPLGKALLGGLAMGFAIAIRVDSLLLAVGVFFWLRLFAAPGRRSVALGFCAGMVPGLATASAINFVKFGALSPLSYGSSGGGTGLDTYAGLMLAAGLVAILAVLVDTRHPRLQNALRFARKPACVSALAALGLLASLSSEAVRGYLFNAYVLVVDLQQVSAFQFHGNVGRLSDGYVSFYDQTKTALLQSAPFGILALWALVDLIQARHVRAHGLALAMIAAPIAFYSLRQWHGGYGLNMRYFLPALPFLCMISALIMRRWAQTIAPRVMRAGLRIGLGATLAGLVFVTLSGVDTTLYRWSVYYAPLWLAGLLGLATLLHGRVRQMATGLAWSAAASAAIIASVTISISDLTQTLHRTALYAGDVNATATVFPEGSLVITRFEPSLLETRRHGVHQMYPGESPPETLVRASHAFLAAGRCVYVQNPDVRNYLDARLPMARVPLNVPGMDGPLAHLAFEPVDQPAHCRLGAR